MDREEWKETPRHQVVYRSHNIQTLSHALRAMCHIPHPILRYHQTLSLRHPDLDLCFSGCIRHDKENRLLTISFPSEMLGYITRIQNSRRFRMVFYWKDPETGFIKEVEVDRRTELSLRWTTLRIYTTGDDNLQVSFDVYLFKRIAKL